MDHTLLVKKLKNLLAGIPVIQKKGAQFYDTPEFNNWRAEILKWLRLGDEYTQAERSRFLNLRHWRYLEYSVRNTFDGSDAYYASAFVEVSGLLQSAIENLEFQLVSNPAQSQPPPPARNGSSISGVTIHQADNIVLGDRNSLTIDRRTVQNFFETLEKDIIAKVPEPQRATLLSKIAAVLRHPAVITVLNDTLSDLFRRHPI